MRRFGRPCALVLGLLALGPVGLDGQAFVRLAEDSPLATDGTVLFAVAEDGRTLVTQALAAASSWVPVALTPAPQSIGGLAVDQEALYLADTAGATLYRVALARGRPSGVLTVLHRGAPLRRPRELALARLLLVADDETRDVYGLPPGRREPHADPASLAALARARAPRGQREPVRGPRPRVGPRGDAGGARGSPRRHRGDHR